MHGSRERQSGSTRTGRNRKFRFRNDTTSCYHASKLVDMRPVPWQTTIVRYRKRLCFRSVVEKSCKENDLQRQSLTSPPKRRRTTPKVSCENVRATCLTSPPKRRRTTPQLIDGSSLFEWDSLTSPPKRRRTTPPADVSIRGKLVPHITAKTTADYTTSCYSLHSNSAPHITAKTTADYTLCSKRSRQKE